MTEFREDKSADYDLRVELEVKSQLDKEVSHSRVIEVGGEKKMSNNNSAAVSMTKFRETKSTAEDLRVEVEVTSQLDKDRTHTISEVGGDEKQLKNKWTVEFKVDETITIIEVGGGKKAEAPVEIGTEKAAVFIKKSIRKSASMTIELQTLM